MNRLAYFLADLLELAGIAAFVITVVLLLEALA